MLLLAKLATYRIFSEGSTVTEIGLLPVANGDPEVRVRAPVLLSMAMPDTVLTLKLAAYRKCPAGSMAREKGALATANGEPGMGSKLPATRLPVPEPTE